MKIVKQVIALLIMFLMLSTITFAEETKNVSFKATIDNGNVSVVKQDITASKDNSNLSVKVIKVVGDVENVIYEGFLGKYDEGKWVYTDFSEIDILVIFNWDSMENEALYIIPTESISDNKTTYTTDNTTQTGTETTPIGDTELMEYDVTYSIVSGDTLNIDINYNVYNGNTQNKSVSLIAALYNNGVLSDIKIQELSVTSQSNATDNIIFPIPENNENYSIKLMVWEGFGTIRPIGKAKQVSDFDIYSREKYLFITSNADVGFNIFMNAATVKGANPHMIHTLQYNPQKITLVDLCGFTYEKELSVGVIENSNVIVENVDLDAGKIKYRFNLLDGRNTGITNVVKFKTLSQVVDEQIIYTIQ